MKLFRFPLVDALGLLLERAEASARLDEKLDSSEVGERLHRYFNFIKEIYDINAAQIMRGEYDPYLFDWPRLFSPIEDMVWHSIRCYGVPMYPQFPAGKYFLDFGDPIKKIAIECDGKEWHDRDRDRERDTRLSQLGWTVYRISGREANRILTNPSDAYEEDCERNDMTRIVGEYVHRCSEGIVEAISVVHYARRSRWINDDLAWSSLKCHQLVRFLPVSHG